MNSLFEVIDLSKEYQLETYSVLILLSDLEQDKLFALFPELKKRFDKVMTYKDWEEYLEINKNFARNNAKHYKRNMKKSEQVAKSLLKYYQHDEIDELLSKKELKGRIEFAMQPFTLTQKNRFKKHYFEHCTYRQIAREENKSISTIHESVSQAKKKFIKNFHEYPNSITRTHLN